MRDHEIICGFSVKMILQKPDFLPVSQEEFVQSTLEAWAHGDEDSRVSDVLLGGVREWGAFWKDESYKVRGAVACRASEEYQLKLVYDPIIHLFKQILHRPDVQIGETQKAFQKWEVFFYCPWALYRQIFVNEILPALRKVSVELISRHVNRSPSQIKNIFGIVLDK